MRFLYDDPRCGFDRLSDLNGIDYLNFPGATDRFAVTYTLHATGRGDWLWVKCFVNDPQPTVPSVVSIWKAADWQEREVWDMFGIRFDGHPDPAPHPDMGGLRGAPRCGRIIRCAGAASVRITPW